MIIERELLVKSGDKTPISGYYIYFRHVPPDQYDNCFIAEKAKSGLYLAKGLTVPDLGACNHKIEWKLIK